MDLAMEIKNRPIKNEPIPRSNRSPERGPSATPCVLQSIGCAENRQAASPRIEPSRMSHFAYRALGFNPKVFGRCDRAAKHFAAPYRFGRRPGGLNPPAR